VLAGSLQSGSEEEHVDDAVSTTYRLQSSPSDADPEGPHHHHDDDDRRRRRSFYSPCQLSYLETSFHVHTGHYPDQRQRQHIARTLNVTETRVQVGTPNPLSLRKVGHIAMLRSVRLSVPISDFVLFTKWRYARSAASNAFDRGQHGRLRPCHNTVASAVIRGVHSSDTENRLPRHLTSPKRAFSCVQVSVYHPLSAYRRSTRRISYFSTFTFDVI